jgi:hypothetical protein
MPCRSISNSYAASRTLMNGPLCETGYSAMIRQLKQFNVARLRVAADVDFAFASYESRREARRGDFAESGSMFEFPRRPDATVISRAILLHYIAQNRDGFWLARDAEGRNGGLFLFKRSALRFARRISAPSGCATMVLSEPLELDVPNQGSQIVGAFAAAIAAFERRAPALVAMVGTAFAAGRKLVAQISPALEGERRHRAAVEQELFRGRYTLASKNDDDLPIP